MAGKKGETKTEEGIAAGLLEFEEELDEAGIDLEGGSTTQDDPPADDEPTSDEPDSDLQDEPTGDVEPVTTSDQEGDEPEGTEDPVVDDEPTAPTDAVATFTVPDDKFFGELRGQEVSAAQLQEAGLLEKMLGRDSQVSHYQKLYEDEKKGREVIEDRVAKLETPSAEEPTMSPEEYAKAIEDQFSPIAQGLVDAGLVESDYVTMNPKKAALDEYRVSVVSTGMDDFDTRIKKLEERVEPWQEKEATHDAVANVGNLIVGMIKENEELYGGLKEETIQTEFFDYLQDGARSGIRFTPSNATAKDMRGAWIAYLLDTGGELPVGKATPTPVGGQKGKTSTGGKPRGRGGKPVTADTDEFSAFEQELEDAEAASLE